MIKDIINYVKSLIGETTSYKVIIGALPLENNSLALAPATGKPETTFMDKGTENTLTLVLNGKSLNQTDVLDTLDNVHRALTLRKSYDKGITNIRTVSSPNYIEGEPQKPYLYGSAIEVKFYTEGV